MIYTKAEIDKALFQISEIRALLKNESELTLFDAKMRSKLSKFCDHIETKLLEKNQSNGN